MYVYILMYMYMYLKSKEEHALRCTIMSKNGDPVSSNRVFNLKCLRMKCLWSPIYMPMLLLFFHFDFDGDCRVPIRCQFYDSHFCNK